MTLNVFEARLRHEEFCRHFGLTDEEVDQTWDLVLDVQDVKYPPGPTAEQEVSLIRLGKIVQERILQNEGR